MLFADCDPEPFTVATLIAKSFTTFLGETVESATGRL
jgi:hypothetical protein